MYIKAIQKITKKPFNIIFVEGNIGSGKTTFLKRIPKFLNDCQIILEPLNIWQNLTDSDGMLFIWKNEDKRCMWMKNTFIPLDLGFFRDDMTLIEVKDLSPKSLKSVCSSEPAKYAIELPRGWFSSNNISNNSKLGFN